MRLAVDATPLLDRPTGVGVFTREVLRRLVVRPDVEVTAFAMTWRGRERLADAVPAGATVVRRPLPARPLRAAWRRVDHPRLDRALGTPDLIHGTNFVVPPARAARVVTVHDLTCIRFPELCTADTLQYPGLLRRAIASGAWVHAVSSFVAAECVDLLGAPTDRVVVVPNGLTQEVPPNGADGPDGAAARADAVRLAGGPRYVLGLSTVEPRKDFPGLVRAFDLLAADDAELRLVVAGPDGWGADTLTDAIRRSPFRERIRRLGWVDDRERQALLSAASVFAYPSRYEGFGLPPLEAMAAGVPVVTTDAGALVETTGDAALHVAVGDAEALAAAIGRVLSDEALAVDLVARGRARAGEYSWDRTAEGLMALYERVLADRSGR